jgi:hypothetical protein
MRWGKFENGWLFGCNKYANEPAVGEARLLFFCVEWS